MQTPEFLEGLDKLMEKGRAMQADCFLARHRTCKNCRSQLPLLKTRWLCKNDLKRVLLTMHCEEESVIASSTPEAMRAKIASKLSSPASAAVGEERWIVRDAQRAKVRSTHGSVAVLGEPTEKIVDLFRSDWNHRGLLVKFKLEVGVSQDELIEIGPRSRLSSGADYLVANTLDMVDGPNAGAFLLGENLREWVPRGTLARRLAGLVQKRSFDIADQEPRESAAMTMAFS